MRSCYLAILGVLFASAIPAQSTGATFGEIVPLGGTPSDLVLDELRGRIYIVNDKAGRVDIYSIPEKKVTGSIKVGSTPLAAAISMDSGFLYVTNNVSSTLSVIDLGQDIVVQTATLPARPQGVEVGMDGRVLISAEGSGTGNLQNSLLIFNRSGEYGQQLIQVAFAPPPPTPANVPAPPATRPVTTFRGKLMRTPDGQYIVGCVTPNTASTILFVYEVQSGAILRSRTVTGQSTVLAMSPDGARFMAGFTLYDTMTLAVVAQFSVANAPFPFPAGTVFNANQNWGGSAFFPDGSNLLAAFNVAPFQLPAPRPSASTLLVSDPRHLGIQLGIKLPESIVAKMVITADGSNAWGMSESGLIHLPLATLYDYPILQPETTQVFLAVDECNRGIASGTLRVNNLGRGKLTVNVPTTPNFLVVQATSGLAPLSMKFIMEPGRSGLIRQPGTNLVVSTAGGVALGGTPYVVNLNSLDAINVSPSIRVYMNYRQPDQRGVIYPVPTVPNSAAEGLQDLVLDEARNRLYITNSGFNRIEVFDTKKMRFVDQIPVGQLPHQMALATDGNTLYVGNTGGESISIVDLELKTVIGQVEFPPIPRQANFAVTNPRAMAMGWFGLQFIMSNGGRWKVVGNSAQPRLPSSVIQAATNSPQAIIAAPQNMFATPDYRNIVTLSGTGQGFLYDSMIDEYTAGRLLFSAPIQSYYGPLGGAASGAYFLANGLILNSAMTSIGGTERPGTSGTGAIVSSGQRNVAGVWALNENQFLWLTTPVRQTVGSATRDDPRTILELIDLRTGAESLAAVVPENPPSTVVATNRVNITPRQMVADSAGTTLYAITLSGLSVIPLSPVTSANRPQIAPGQRGIVNAIDGSTTIRPGSFIAVNGTNLASQAVADIIPPPTVLGGSCVTFSDTSIPLLETSPGQIGGQVPDTLRPGIYVVQVRSLGNALSSDPVLLTVQKPAPIPTPSPSEEEPPQQ